MKVLILAGGYGTRISEESDTRPKPMIEVGGKPILWHIMKHYSHYGFNDFVILAGYKQYVIKEYFSNYFLHSSDVTLDLEKNQMEIHKTFSEKWKVTIIDTGQDTMTGGRIKRAKEYIGENTFMLTYGDGVSDVNLSELLSEHKKNGKFVTMTVVQPDGRFGAVEINSQNEAVRFHEKPKGDGGWINGGFFVCEPDILDYISEDKNIFEKDVLEKLAEDSQLGTRKHFGFWKAMDSLRDKNHLCDLWEKESAPWRIW